MSILIFEMSCIYPDKLYFPIEIFWSGYTTSNWKTALNSKYWATRCSAC